MLESVIRNGEEALLQNAAATGGIRGGNTQRGLADFRADAFADQLNQQIARLAGMAGLGMGATDSVSGFGANASSNIANLFGQQGQVRAGGLLTRGGINNQLWNNAGSFLDNAAGNAISGGLKGLIKGLF